MAEGNPLFVSVSLIDTSSGAAPCVNFSGHVTAELEPLLVAAFRDWLRNAVNPCEDNQGRRRVLEVVVR